MAPALTSAKTRSSGGATGKVADNDTPKPSPSAGKAEAATKNGPSKPPLKPSSMKRESSDIFKSFSKSKPPVKHENSDNSAGVTKKPTVGQGNVHSHESER